MYSIPHHRHLRACQLLLISFVLVLFSIKSASGQAVYNTLQDVKPPSPEAISMVKQGFTDVSLYTGKINYGIPLYTLSQNGVSVPVSLSYGGGGGIKVEGSCFIGRLGLVAAKYRCGHAVNPRHGRRC